MSEYQYYEFLAVDEPLSAKQMAELRSISTRASITPTSFINEYHWGDLKGDPVDFMRRYFDAHVYVANWCACWLFLRVAKDTFDAKSLQSFETQSAFSISRTKTHWLLEWSLNETQDYDRFAMEDGRGWMGRLAPLRDELLRGDTRPLYLGWLAGVSAGEVGQDDVEPPAPPGLSRLTAAQQALVEFIEIDADLLTAAGLADPQSASRETEDAAELDVWIDGLPAAEIAAVLKQLLTGQSQLAERRLKSRLLAWRREQHSCVKSETRRRTVAELWELAASAAESRKQLEAAQRKKAEAERRAQREKHLRTLAADFDRCWRAADKRAEGGTASAYDAVLLAISDLAEAYQLCATQAVFDGKLRQFISRHEKRGALIRRLVKAGLCKKVAR